jgi:hypothetical protein
MAQLVGGAQLYDKIIKIFEINKIFSIFIIMPRYAFPSLTPMYGLGSGARTIGSTAISSPRSKIGSAGRVYAFMKTHQGQQAALSYFQTAIFGPYVIRNGKLVWN